VRELLNSWDIICLLIGIVWIKYNPVNRNLLRVSSVGIELTNTLTSTCNHARILGGGCQICLIIIPSCRLIIKALDTLQKIRDLWCQAVFKTKTNNPAHIWMIFRRSIVSNSRTPSLMQSITWYKSPYQSGTVCHCICNTVVPVQDKMADEEMQAQPHALLISALDIWVISFTSRHFYARGNSHCAHGILGLVGPGAGLDVFEQMKISCPAEIWTIISRSSSS
jgi:hypothetical protein